MRKFYFLFSILLFSQSIKVSAQAWYPSYIPHGRSVNEVIIKSPADIQVVGGNYSNDSIESIFRSTSGGLGWDFIGDFPMSSWLKSFAYSDSLHGSAVGANGKIKKTIDGGLNWNYVSSPINCNFNKIVFLNSQTGIAVGGRKLDTAQIIMRTTNAGQSWVVVHNQHNWALNSVSFADSLVGVAVGDSGVILKTTNGGLSWSAISSPTEQILNSVWFSSSQNLVAVGGTELNPGRIILRSTNAGNNWSVITDDTNPWLKDVYFPSIDTGYAVGANSTLLMSTDTGQNWVQQNMPGVTAGLIFNTIRFYDRHLGAIGCSFGNAYIYTDAIAPDVATLNALLIDTNNAMLAGSVNPNGIATGYFFTYSSDSTIAFN